MRKLFKNQLNQMLAGIYSYPLSVFSAFFLGTCIIILEENPENLPNLVEFIERHLATLVIFYLGSWGVHFYQQRSQGNKWLWGLAVALGSTILFDSWFLQFVDRSYVNTSSATILLYGLFTLGATLLWATYGLQRSDIAMVSIIFTGFLSGLFTYILNVGFFLAIGGLNLLFELDLSDKIFFRTLIFCSFPLLAAIFAGNLKNLDLEEEHLLGKRAMQLFNYVLLPLTILYLFITIGYLIKSLIQGSFGSEVSHWLSLGYVGIGMLTYVYGNTLQPEHNSWWTEKLKRVFIAAEAIVLLALLSSVGNNVLSYGFTMQRLIVLLFGLWLIIAFFWLWRNPMAFRNWLTVMVSLAFIGSIGWFSVDEWPVRSQVSRLESFFNEANSRQEIRDLLSSEEELLSEVINISDYLIENHSRPERFIAAFDTTLSEDFDEMKSAASRVYLQEIMLGSLWMEAEKKQSVGNTSMGSMLFLDHFEASGEVGSRLHRLQEVEIKASDEPLEWDVNRSDGYAGVLSINSDLSSIQYRDKNDQILLDQPFETAIKSKAAQARALKQEVGTATLTHEFKSEEISIWMNVNWVDFEGKALKELNAELWVVFGN
jgi:hypothetical protein